MTAGETPALLLNLNHSHVCFSLDNSLVNRFNDTFNYTRSGLCTDFFFWEGLMLRKTSAIIVVLFLGAFALAAQEITGTILGTVTDSSGAVVPHAKVTVINTDRNTVLRTTQTDNNDYYAAPLLPIGRYAVTVAASGFKSFSKTDIELNVSDRLSVNAVLQPGS